MKEEKDRQSKASDFVGAVLMARANVYSTRPLTVTTTKYQEPVSLGNPDLSRISSPPVHRTISHIKRHWIQQRSDAPLLIRSPTEFRYSSDSNSSSYSFSISPLQEGERRSLASGVAMDTFFESCGNKSQRFKATSTSKVHAKPLPTETSRSSPAITAKPSQISTKRDNWEETCTDVDERKNRSDSFTDSGIRRPILDLPRRSPCDSMGKQSTQCIRSVQQARRTYASMSESCQHSFGESDDSEDCVYTESDSGRQLNPETFQPFTRTQAPRLSIQTHDGSSTPVSTISQANVTGRSSFGYARENGSALDTPSPISRSSLDFVFRSKTRANVDPVSRAATVQAARQAFEEKEEAKTRKFEEQQMKAEEKQTRRKEKEHWRTSTTDDAANSPTCEEPSEKPNAPGTFSATPVSRSQSTFKSWKSRSKNTWMLFLTWLRTRIFKLRRKLMNIH